MNINEYTTRVIKESLLRSGENPLNSYTGVKRDFETKPEPLIINKNYSQGKLKREVSQMKV